MIREDKDALICDLAETYSIYDYTRLPLQTVAIFAIGLPEDSRIKMKLKGQVFPLTSMIQAAIHDQLNILIWFQTEDGQKGLNRPSKLTDMLLGKTEENDGLTFCSGKAFEEERQLLIYKITGGGDGN